MTKEKASKKAGLDWLAAAILADRVVLPRATILRPFLLRYQGGPLNGQAVELECETELPPPNTCVLNDLPPVSLPSGGQRLSLLFFFYRRGEAALPDGSWPYLFEQFHACSNEVLH